MAASSKILLNHNLKHFICTTAGNFAKKYTAREGKFMKKMLSGDVGKRHWYLSQERIQSPLKPEKLTSNHVTRRMTVLNKLFMEYITDLMATGNTSSKLLGRSIEITHVKVTPDFNFVLVYWYSAMHNEHEETEKILNDCAYSLRHELTQLRVIGQVPLIKFVKNKQLADLNELENRLKVADYGDDHEPVAPSPVIKDELVLNMKLPKTVKEKILKAVDSEEFAEEEEEEAERAFDVILPPMRHDVLGLDHHAIMSRVKQSLSKRHERGREGLANVVTFESTLKSSIFDPSAFKTAKEESRAFMDFLAKRRSNDKRNLRRQKRMAFLSQNIASNAFEHDDDEIEYVAEAEDVDVFEDISLESLK